ncbi:hypothetical protein AB0442_42445 [Kitasatospora sp. NPDC085895]|uniref:hypothetical protein n=1 Tax=Kitasatospora sp. NPDC085895 TaxID=3155057 RepID=UPI00344F335E
MAVATIQEYIGVRTPDEVAAAAQAAACPGGDRNEAKGAAAVHRWVLDPCRPAPITGSRRPAELHDLDLAVEERAALEAARNPQLPADRRSYARGAARALDWVLGFAPFDA